MVGRELDAVLADLERSAAAGVAVDLEEVVVVLVRRDGHAVEDRPEARDVVCDKSAHIERAALHVEFGNGHIGRRLPAGHTAADEAGLEVAVRYVHRRDRSGRIADEVECVAVHVDPRAFAEHDGRVAAAPKLGVAVVRMEPSAVLEFYRHFAHAGAARDIHALLARMAVETRPVCYLHVHLPFRIAAREVEDRTVGAFYPHFRSASAQREAAVRREIVVAGGDLDDAVREREAVEGERLAACRRHRDGLRRAA